MKWKWQLNVFRRNYILKLFVLNHQIEVTGNSLYKYVHPCDHEELANQLGGQIPLEDMEIFDGLFCSDSVFLMSNYLKKGSKKKNDVNPHRSFFLRMKSTLTSRGKNVNLRASTYRVFYLVYSFELFFIKNTCALQTFLVLINIDYAEESVDRLELFHKSVTTYLVT